MSVPKATPATGAQALGEPLKVDAASFTAQLQTPVPTADKPKPTPQTTTLGVTVTERLGGAPGVSYNGTEIRAPIDIKNVGGNPRVRAQVSPYAQFNNVEIKGADRSNTRLGVDTRLDYDVVKGRNTTVTVRGAAGGEAVFNTDGASKKVNGPEGVNGYAALSVIGNQKLGPTGSGVTANVGVGTYPERNNVTGATNGGTDRVFAGVEGKINLRDANIYPGIQVQHRSPQNGADDVTVAAATLKADYQISPNVKAEVGGAYTFAGYGADNRSRAVSGDFGANQGEVRVQGRVNISF